MIAVQKLPDRFVALHDGTKVEQIALKKVGLRDHHISCPTANYGATEALPISKLVGFADRLGRGDRCMCKTHRYPVFGSRYPAKYPPIREKL